MVDAGEHRRFGSYDSPDRGFVLFGRQDVSADELERYGQARRAGGKAALLAETGAKMQWSQCLDEHASVLDSKEDVISTTRVSMRDSTYKSRSNFSPKVSCLRFGRPPGMSES